MGDGTIDAYNLASAGVNVDKAQIHKDDGELTKAQNCTTDPTGLGGGVRKRPGLVEFTPSALGGAIIGGLGVPLVLQANNINGTSLTGGPTRTTYYGRMVKGLGYGVSAGWWSSSTGFTTAASQISSATPANPRANEIDDSSAPNGEIGTGMPGAAVVYNNKLIYCATYSRSGGDRPPIRIFDGVVDTELVRIPHNPNFTSNSTTINSLLLVGDIIYLSTQDGNVATDGGNRTGRVFSLNPSTGALVPIGAQFPTGYSPYALAWHMGRLWAGTTYRSGGSDLPGDVSWIRVGIDPAWTLDHTMTAGRGCSMLFSYNGVLFAGNWTGNSGTSAVVETRSTLGVWAVSLTVTVGVDSMVLNAVQFLGNLYITLNDATANNCTTRKFNGASWSIVHSPGNSTPRPQLWVDNGILYAGGGGRNVQAILFSSPDGSVWTNLTANLTGANVSGISTLGTLAT